MSLRKDEPVHTHSYVRTDAETGPQADSGSARVVPRIGLAFSGGGYRATAFGLGALRALNDRHVLDDVEVVSGISGGSLLTAMWAYGPRDFAEFDATVTDLLRQSLQLEIVRRTCTPRRGAANALSVLRTLPLGPLRQDRTSTRTEALVDALRARPFGSKFMGEVTRPGLSTIISATDLATGNAVRFGSEVSSCSPHGVINEQVQVAEAVAASAAFPALLPHLNRTYTFTRTDQSTHRQTMLMTDGGVYDNLGVSPLLPGRSRTYTSHVHDLDYLIAVDAGVGRTVGRAAPNYMVGRLKRSFEIAHTKAQDGSRARIHELRDAGRLRGMVYAYLGTSDARLPTPIPDLVPRSATSNYPTNFAKMRTEDLHLLTTRGEQLVRVLLDRYCPNLGQ